MKEDFVHRLACVCLLPDQVIIYSITHRKEDVSQNRTFVRLCAAGSRYGRQAVCVAVVLEKDGKHGLHSSLLFREILLEYKMLRICYKIDRDISERIK